MQAISQQMEKNEMLGEMFDLDQTSPNITKHNVRCPDKVCKRPSISPHMTSDQVLDQKLDRLHKTLGAISQCQQHGIWVLKS